MENEKVYYLRFITFLTAFIMYSAAIHFPVRADAHTVDFILTMEDAKVSTQGIDLVLVMDISASFYDIVKNKGNTSIMDAVQIFVAGLPENVSTLSLITFNKESFPHLVNSSVTDMTLKQLAADEVIAHINAQFDKYKGGNDGTNIGNAMLHGARLVAGEDSSGKHKVMVLITDAINSLSVPAGEWERNIAEFASLYPEGFVVHAIELVIGTPGRGETKIDLREITEPTAGIFQVETSFKEERMALLFDNIKKALPQPQGQSQDLVATDIHIINAPPEVSGRLGIEGTIQYMDGNATENVYQEIPVSIHIKKEDALGYLETDTINIPAIGESYHEVIRFAEPGGYEYYLSWQSNVESERRSITVLDGPSIGILMSTPLINDKPLTEMGLLAGDDLVVHGSIQNLYGDSGDPTIESMESEYQDNSATFYIRKDGDPNHHTAVMPVRDSSYRLVMGLPEPGEYEYYIQSQGINSDSERITVHPAVTPLGFSLKHNGSNRGTLNRSDRNDEDKIIFELTAKMLPDSTFAGNEIYYNRYQAFIYIKANKAREYTAVPMKADGDSFSVQVELVDDGLYVYYVEVMIDGKSARKSEDAEIRVDGLFYPIATSVFFSMSAALLFCAAYIQRSPHRYDFIISVGNNKNPNILTIAVHLNRDRKTFNFEHLLKGNNRTKLESLNGFFDQMQNEIIRKIKSLDVRFKYISKREKLMVRYCNESAVIKTEELDFNNSMKFEHNDGYIITLLFVGWDSTRLGH